MRRKIFGIIFMTIILASSVAVLNTRAEESTYTYSETASANGITLKVEWNEPILGQTTTFHVTASGGSGKYMFRMDVPSYADPNEQTYESVADPTRGEWQKYTDECTAHDYEFTMTASGTYNFRFYIMDKSSKLYYLRTNMYITVQDAAYPSLSSMISSAVAQCNKETNGSEYEKALWLHDWLLDQLEYDNSLKWSSAESALTRGQGTCQSYESAYAKLLSAAGIENAETRDEQDGHTWNAVKLDGQWYQVDCTWDDSNTNYYNFDNRHLYFGLTDELMSIAHPGHKTTYISSGYNTPSTCLENNYFVKSGEASTWADGYKERIQSHLDRKEESFSIETDNSGYPASISGIQNGIIAYVLNQMEWTEKDIKVDLNAVGNATQLVFNVGYKETAKNPKVSYRTQVQTYGWEKSYVSNGSVSGTMGKGKRLETIQVKVEDCDNLGIEYRTHVQSYGWLKWTKDGESSGTVGEGKRLEAIQIGLTGANAEKYDVYYRVHAQSYGWLDWTKNGAYAGTAGLGKRLEAIQIVVAKKNADAPGKVNGILSVSDLAYVHTSHVWDDGKVIKEPTCTARGEKLLTCKECGETKKADIAATGHKWDEGEITKPAETYVENGIKTYTCTKCGATKTEEISKAFPVDVSYRTQVQTFGWQKTVKNGELGGTIGQGKRMETMTISVKNLADEDSDLGIRYNAHLQSIGWQGDINNSETWKKDGENAGTVGMGKRLEAIQIKLSGNAAEKYDVYYRVHAQSYGWLNWAKNGEISGTAGYGKRLEAIQIIVVEKGMGINPTFGGIKSANSKSYVVK